MIELIRSLTHSTVGHREKCKTRIGTGETHSDILHKAFFCLRIAACEVFNVASKVQRICAIRSVAHDRLAYLGISIIIQRHGKFLKLLTLIKCGLNLPIAYFAISVTS